MCSWYTRRVRGTAGLHVRLTTLCIAALAISVFI
ncbi:hypothetical protein CBA19CS91_07740 [Paraburkholderia hospita]|jgi:hypothetical protein|nr:hypothetical protein CBA19CS91_07740 [Paraburkholderia hospita]